MALTEALVTNKLQVALAGLVLVGGAGATYVALGGDLPFLNQDQMANSVPEDVDVVMYVDPNVAEDETTKELVNGFIGIAQDENEFYDGPDDYEEWLGEAETNSSLEMEALNSAMLFGRYPDGGFSEMDDETAEDVYFGLLVDSEWDESTFIEEVENGSGYEQTEYEGYTLYRQKNVTAGETRGFVGVLADGRYVVGTEDAVKDTIDVDRGASDSFGGELRSAYDNTRSGSRTYLKFAARFPEDDTLEAAESELSDDNQFSAFRNIRVFSGSYYTNDDEIGMQMRIATEDEAAAEDLAAILDGSFALTKQFARTDEMQSLADDVEVNQNGKAVTMTFERPVEEILETFEAAIDDWSDIESDSETGSDSGFGTSVSALAGPGSGTDPPVASTARDGPIDDSPPVQSGAQVTVDDMLGTLG